MCTSEYELRNKPLKKLFVGGQIDDDDDDVKL